MAQEVEEGRYHLEVITSRRPRPTEKITVKPGDVLVTNSEKGECLHLVHEDQRSPHYISVWYWPITSEKPRAISSELSTSYYGIRLGGVLYAIQV